MADTTTFATVDAAAAPVDWNWGPRAFATVDAAAAVVAMVGVTPAAETVNTGSHTTEAQPGRWRGVEG